MYQLQYVLIIKRSAWQMIFQADFEPLNVQSLLIIIIVLAVNCIWQTTALEFKSDQHFKSSFVNSAR